MRNILLLIAIVSIFLILLVVANRESQVPQDQQAQPVAPVRSTTGESDTSNFTLLVSKDVCEGCHMSGKPFIPQASSVKAHINGGAYCLTCHRISHEVHPINDNVTCEKCHGASPSRPTYVNGNIACNNCHDYPDSLAPSRGNIITIHRSRGITCNKCHTDECTKCHLEVGTDARWGKRLGHFRALLNS